ncbi:hypothetical protein [Amycolatopsis antarctica]|nr:hypothetical protein [Amycolatopsis antarctica]
MTSSANDTHLPPPAEWKAGVPVAAILVIALCAGLAVLGAFRGLPEFAAADPDGTLLFIGATTPVYLAVAFTVFAQRFAPRRAASVTTGTIDELDEPVTVLPQSRAGWASALALAVALLLVGAFLASGPILALVFGQSGATDGLVQGALGLALLAGSLVFLGEVLRKRIRPGYVALSPYGVHCRMWNYVGLAAWDLFVPSAAEQHGPMIVLAVPDGDSSAVWRTSPWWRPAELRLQPHVVLRALNLAVDPVLLYHAIRFYEESPELRAELGTRAAAERLVSQDLARR